MGEVKVSKVIAFVQKELCNNKTERNAELFLNGAFLGGKKLKIVFHNHPEEQYQRLLAFCIAYGGIILSTDPETYTCVIRARNDVDKYFVANRETKEIIKEAANLAEAKKLISGYEKEDKHNGVYEKGFYDVIDDSKLSYLYS
ncbi:hypothetical protein SAMN02910358_02289 [Lachnospiraceae bacterium XBB1006]|nr:hypothetical protein SAMN02910358_02289 [Lachnospiraceae bacterium XBB1006]